MHIHNERLLFKLLSNGRVKVKGKGQLENVGLAHVNFLRK